ncbi:hypothetical protein HY407_05005, partial [Candidatus Gottesmanbacteria bacterium]|nr:hypothetical protein [Candidatus Gottesmanbacteria bacterium]
DTKIIIKVGDLFNEDGNIVIGMNDVFDTEKGEIIKSNSIQGQFLTKIYNDDRSKLDGDLKNALKKCIGQPDKEKSKGNKIRYPIGTVATLNAGNKKYFCSAYSYMNNNLQAKSDIGKLVVSLEALWEAIRLKGECDNVAMAILGSDLARIGNASKSNLIKLIVSSFILASREKWITKKLTIVIHPDSFEKVNLLELDDFLQSF